jgi:flagellar basal body rod protein FlgC
MADKVGSIYYEASIDSKGVKSGAEEIQGHLGSLKTGFSGLSSSLSQIGIAISGVIAAKAFIGFLKDSVTAAGDAGRIMKQTNAVIASTGGVAGLSADSIRKMAEEIQKSTRISDDAVQTGMNMLLTFTKIGKDVFPQATQAMIDMATAMNGGITPDAEQLKDTAIRLGKALQDPVLGVTALRRVGVNFNETQTKMIEKMVESGKQMEAQKYILAELSREFGGSASAQVKGFGGQLEQLKNQFNDFQELVGNIVIPVLSYMLTGFEGLGGAINVLIAPLRVLASVFLLVTAQGKVLGIALSTIFASIYAAMTGNFKLAGDVITAGFDSLKKEAQNASERMTQIWTTENNKQGKDYSALMNNMVDEESEKSKKIKKDLEEETEKFNDEMAKRKKTFEQNLADLIWAHQDKVKEIESDMTEENKDFKEKMEERVSDFKESLNEMKTAHDEKVADIKKSMEEEKTDTADKNAETLADAQEEIAEEKKAYDKKMTELETSLAKEEARGKNSSQTKIRLIKEEMATVKGEYDEKTAKIDADAEEEIAKANLNSAKKLANLQASIDEENLAYDADVLKATERDAAETLRLQKTHEERLLEYKTSLDAEKKILSDHQLEVDAVKDKARTDDITRLQLQYADENAEATKQHLKKMTDIQNDGYTEGATSANATTTGLQAGSSNLINTAKNISFQTQSAMSGGGGGGGSWGSIGENWIDNLMNGIWRAVNNSWDWLSGLASSIGNLFSNSWNWAVSKLPHGAKGFSNFKGGLAVVGENGPELVNLPQGADVIPNNVAFGSNKGKGEKGVNQTISIHIDRVDNKSDIDTIGRELGFKASLMPN